MKQWIFAPILLGCSLAAPVFAEAPSTPYAGQQQRSIKALSDQDVDGLLAGEGVGMAKAAELNGYPGPIHVLTLGKELKLSASQRRQLQAIVDRMSAAAKPLGAELVEHERVLDKLFAGGEITSDRLAVETGAIAALQGRLRMVHLSAHLEARALLSSDQIARYEQLRGYGNPAASHHHHG